ncbi:cell division protein FtsW [Gardnerella vaginalis]|nr:bacterial cell division membrane protein [Gardnerella vaginalis AMD]NSX41858.1 cell division protein FtsW [Gardnerella vaginalis]NSX44237.1 cell division protein FtsW [Gardnerella vaginalis]
MVFNSNKPKKFLRSLARKVSEVIMEDHIEADSDSSHSSQKQKFESFKKSIRTSASKVGESISKVGAYASKAGKELGKSVGKSVSKSVSNSVTKVGRSVGSSFNESVKFVKDVKKSKVAKQAKQTKRANLIKPAEQANPVNTINPVKPAKLTKIAKPANTAKPAKSIKYAKLAHTVSGIFSSKKDYSKNLLERKTQDSELKKYVGLRSLTNPLWCLYGMRVSVVILSIFGLFMVFSSSSVTMITYGIAPWGQGVNQTMYCVLGLIGYIFASRLPVTVYRRYVAVIYIISVIAQFLTFVPGLRREVNGNAGWIAFGPITLQPAEITKLALCIWLPIALIAAKQAYERVQMRAYIPVAAGLGVSLLLVIAGKDLGTALIIILIALIAFYLGGFPTRWLIGSIFIAIAMVAMLVLTSQNRMRRILATLHGCDAKAAKGVCFQAIHAQYAMASGGLLGVGIGNSREKWNYLPYAHNDFIFAIIGEEMGFLVAAAVILLYVIIGWCILSSALKAKSQFISIVLMCIATWIVGQGLVNILVVVQILPVMGVPMPFVSAGGSSLVMCLVAIGVADGLMRSNPQLTISK